MATDVPVLVGVRYGVYPERDRNWAWNRARLESWGYDVYEGTHDFGPYCMSVAANRARALYRGNSDVLLYVTADHWAETPGQVAEAIRVARRHRQLTFAHDHLTLLDEDATAYVVEHNELPDRDLGTRHPNTYSGVIAIPTKLWDFVEGFDERFVGWGWEDLAFWASCSAFGHGYKRVPGDIYHLDHPRSRAENEEQPFNPQNQVLGQRYLEAKWSLEETRKIIIERP